VVGLNYFVAGLLSVMVMAIVGGIMERLFFRRLRGQFLPSLVMSLGLVLGIEGIVWLNFGIVAQAVPPVFPGVVHFLGASVSRERLVIIAAGLVLIGGLFLFIRYTRAGKAIRAVEQDPEGAVLQGIDLDDVTRLVFMVSFALTAVAAVLVAPTLALDPSIGETPLLKGLVIIVLGGMGSVTGTLLGGFIIGFTESIVGTFYDPVVASLVSAMFLMTILIFKPSGLLPYRM
ncbi:MAG TPA: branched-chain amino acid ABC transporter permease, partial [Candidatus Methylomirabilis sp.]|nr:branched-chain amino acid ABC transporter permease [Candidatus Methylomirabilis sp.]